MAAPKEKRSAGQPPKFNSLAELQAKIDEYFETKVGSKIIKDNDGNVCTDKKGNPVYEVTPPTISGLALFLGFKSRQSLYDYKERAEYSYALHATTLKIEEFAESQLFVGNHQGAIFWLKNKGWKDNQDVTHLGAGGGPVKVVVEFVNGDGQDS